MSRLRKIYFAKLVLRVFILGYVTYMYFTDTSAFDIVIGWNMFNRFSPLHILYLFWLYDMLCQLIPNARNIALGSQKLFLNRFRDGRVDFKGIASDFKEGINDQKEKLKETVKDKKNRLSQINYESLRDYVIKTTKKAYRVFVIWAALMVVIGILYFTETITYREIFLTSVVFFVCDLICVLVWCPFRLILGNKCCTTCRIFNWDHAMMFLPLAYIPGLYTTSLLILSIFIWIIWEVHMMIYPERFWEVTNVSLRCTECTDKLCTQYCQKLRNR